MKITDGQLKQIYAHAQESYPAECCGFLLGTFEHGGLVRQTRRATNQNSERNDRFLISAEEFAQMQLAADEAELEIIGIYHSHPDWPAIPSQTDIDNAWEGVYYLITSVHEGRPLHTQIWQLIEDEPRYFEGVALEIVEEKAL